MEDCRFHKRIFGLTRRGIGNSGEVLIAETLDEEEGEEKGVVSC
jgi:hypothetical protein